MWMPAFVPAKWRRWRGLAGGDGRCEEHGITEEKEASQGRKYLVQLGKKRLKLKTEGASDLFFLYVLNDRLQTATVWVRCVAPPTDGLGRTTQLVHCCKY